MDPSKHHGRGHLPHSKKVGEEKILESIRPICLMNTAAKIVTSVWAKRLSKSLVRLTITGDLTFERDYVRKKMLDTIKQLSKHMYHPQ